MATKFEVLESIPFFNVLEQDEMERLAMHMELNSSSKYSYIFSDGEPADFFYILSEGSVKIGTHHEDGREIIKQVLHPRMIFGEQALIHPHEPQHNFAMALSQNTGYFKIDIRFFRDLMDNNPQIALGVVSMIGYKMRHTENQLESLIFKDARGRIIDFILENAHACGRQVGLETFMKHSLTQQDIANYTGTSRQTVTAVLNDLRKTNKIYFTRNSILIRDLSALA